MSEYNASVQVAQLVAELRKRVEGMIGTQGKLPQMLDIVGIAVQIMEQSSSLKGHEKMSVLTTAVRLFVEQFPEGALRDNLERSLPSIEQLAETALWLFRSYDYLSQLSEEVQSCCFSSKPKQGTPSIKVPFPLL